MLNTQLDAYTEVQSKAATDRQKILHYARTLDFGFTTQEMADYLEYPFHEVQPRISELVASDQLRDTGKRKEGRQRMSAIWEFNPEPKPRPKKLKPIGDKVLFGKMIEAAYINAFKPNAHNLVRMERLAKEWINDFSNTIRGQNEKTKI